MRALLHRHRPPALRLARDAWRNLPGNAPPVFAPAALALLADIAEDGVPVAVGLLLIVGGDLEVSVVMGEAAILSGTFRLNTVLTIFRAVLRSYADQTSAFRFSLCKSHS